MLRVTSYVKDLLHCEYDSNPREVNDIIGYSFTGWRKGTSGWAMCVHQNNRPPIVFVILI
jgi:hypothetical protein